MKQGRTISFWAVKYALTGADVQYNGRIHNFEWSDVDTMRKAGFRVISIKHICPEGIIPQAGKSRMKYTHRERWPLIHFESECYNKQRCPLTNGVMVKGKMLRHMPKEKEAKSGRKASRVGA